MTVYLDRTLRPRPRLAVAALMVVLHDRFGSPLAREQWLVELLNCALHGQRQAVAS